MILSAPPQLHSRLHDYNTSTRLPPRPSCILSELSRRSLDTHMLEDPSYILHCALLPPESLRYALGLSDCREFKQHLLLLLQIGCNDGREGRGGVSRARSITLKRRRRSHFLRTARAGRAGVSRTRGLAQRSRALEGRHHYGRPVFARSTAPTAVIRLRREQRRMSKRFGRAAVASRGQRKKVDGRLQRAQDVA